MNDARICKRNKISPVERIQPYRYFARVQSFENFSIFLFFYLGGKRGEAAREDIAIDSKKLMLHKYRLLRLLDSPEYTILDISVTDSCSCHSNIKCNEVNRSE